MSTAKRLTDDQRQALVADIETGDYTGKELANKHHVSMGTIAIAKRKLRGDGVTTSKSTSGVTTTKQLLAQVTKSITPHIKTTKEIVGANNEVIISVSIKVGKKSFSDLDELISYNKDHSAALERKAKIAALEAQLAALRAS